MPPRDDIELDTTEDEVRELLPDTNELMDANDQQPEPGVTLPLRWGNPGDNQPPPRVPTPPAPTLPTGANPQGPPNLGEGSSGPPLGARVNDLSIAFSLLNTRMARHEERIRALERGQGTSANSRDHEVMQLQIGQLQSRVHFLHEESIRLDTRLDEQMRRAGRMERDLQAIREWAREAGPSHRQEDSDTSDED